MRLTVKVAHSLEALRPEWEQLERTSFPRTPFTQPRWSSLWLRHFAQQRSSLNDTLLLLSFRDQEGALRGVAPMVVSQRPAFGPLRTRMLQSLGSDPNVTELSGRTSAPEHAPAVMTALLQYLEQHRASWDLVYFSSLRDTEREVLAQSPGVHWAGERPDFVLELPPTWEAFRAGLGRNIKESLRKCYNSLKRDGYDFEVKVRTAPAEMEEALTQFFRLHAARASLPGAVEHHDVFAHEHSRRFLRDYVHEAAAAGEARFFQLVIDGQVVATRLGFVLDEHLYLYFSGFDPAWRHHSVMTTTVAEAIRWAIDARLRFVNLSPGRDVSKTRWGPCELTFHAAYLRSHSLRGALVHHAYQASRDEHSKLSRLLAFAKRRS